MSPGGSFQPEHRFQVDLATPNTFSSISPRLSSCEDTRRLCTNPSGEKVNGTYSAYWTRKLAGCEDGARRPSGSALSLNNIFQPFELLSRHPAKQTAMPNSFGGAVA